MGIINEVSLKEVSKDIGIPISELKYYNDNMLIPIGRDMEKIVAYTGMCKEEIELRLGVISSDVYNWINKNAASIIKKINFTNITRGFVTPVFRTQYGTLYNADCINVLRGMPDESVDMVFADPPFNLNKEYGDNINDSLARSEYISWCEVWIKECIRVLKPGGAIFIYNLPYWNTFISNILNRYLNFRHWIAVSMKGLLPVQGKLQPEHYALLYYIKGERPKTFNKQRIPLVTCRHCGGEIRDYGGKKSGMNPEGISISDIFMDINPVRHKKYKNRQANELPLRLLYRIIALTTNEGDTVLDPFGGSGTTYAVSEYLKRNWVGMEIGDTNIIVERLNDRQQDINMLHKIENESNKLFTEDQIKLREKNNFWGYEKLTNKTTT